MEGEGIEQKQGKRFGNSLAVRIESRKEKGRERRQSQDEIEGKREGVKG